MKRLLPIAAIAVLLGVWELYVKLGHISDYVLPAPNQIAAALYNDRATLWSNFLVTGQEIVYGIAAATVSALIIAFAIHFSGLIRSAFYPLVVASQAVPIVLLASVLVLWFNFGLLGKLVVVALVSFFPLVVTTIAALERVDPNLLKLMKTLDASRWQTFKTVELPSALPGLFTGAKLAAVFSVIGAVLAEQQGGSSSNPGLGLLMTITLNNLEVPEAYAAVAILCGFAIMLFALLTVIERRALPWAYHHSR
jgi:ABC-type nitrate/sulfonate/bicarbonate transport system permease component